MASKKIVVVGDIMLDRYVFGEIDKVSPEAHAPILDVTKEVTCLGGAGNVAVNLMRHDDIHLIGYIGDDEAGRLVKEHVEEQGIYGHLFATTKTTTKTRLSQPQILRVDDEENVKAHVDDEIIKDIKNIDPDLIIVSDYAKGTITQNLFDKLKGLEKRIIVDPKPKNNVDYSGCYLVVPNLKESKDLVGTYENMLVTKGVKGMTLYKNGKKAFSIPSYPTDVYDVTGAGDIVMATLATRLVHNCALETAIVHSNKMASIGISKKGNRINTNEI